jgi:hypothetical protein
MEIQGVEMLTLMGGLCCIGFVNPIGVAAGVWRQRLALSIGPNSIGSPGDGNRICE